MRTPELSYRCASCAQDKPASAFHRRSPRRHPQPRTAYPYCKACRRLRDQHRRATIREFLWEQKARRGACLDCGQTYHPHVMDFDHRPTEQKCFDLSDSGGRTIPSLLEEIAKCDVVCAICHRIRTWNRAVPEQPLTRHGDV